MKKRQVIPTMRFEAFYFSLVLAILTMAYSKAYGIGEVKQDLGTVDGEKSVKPEYVYYQGENIPYSKLKFQGETKRQLYYLSNLLQLKKPLPPHLVTLVLPGISRAQGGTIQHGILFSFHSYQAKKVSVAGNFNQWHRVPMQQNRHGVWYKVV
jgi:hypothetical protein